MVDAVDANAGGASTTASATCGRLMAHRNEALGIWRPEFSKVLGAATAAGLLLFWSEIRLLIVRGPKPSTCSYADVARYYATGKLTHHVCSPGQERNCEAGVFVKRGYIAFWLDASASRLKIRKARQSDEPSPLRVEPTRQQSSDRVRW
jgi:hypothetical protein